MIAFPGCKIGALLIAVSALSACATSVSEADLYGPNFGRQVIPHFDASVDPDPSALLNGLYGSSRFQNRCYRCSTPWPNSSDWAP